MAQKDGYVGQVAINMEMGEEILPTKTPPPYDPEQYQFEKVIGKRLSSGSASLKRLSARHKNVIAMHLRCLSNRDIAFVTGMSEVNVGKILRDPLCQEIIGSYLDDMDGELLSLAPLAVDAVRSGLTSDDAKVQLNAADKYFKATGKYAKAESGVETAEVRSATKALRGETITGDGSRAIPLARARLVRESETHPTGQVLPSA